MRGFPGPAAPLVLVSCYELGHQPLAVASPAGRLHHAGFSPVMVDLAVEAPPEALLRSAGFVGISTPMHTALRLAIPLAEKIRRINPGCHICFFGIYASLHRDWLLQHLADSVLGGETELPLLNLVRHLAGQPGPGLAGVSLPTTPHPPRLERSAFFLPRREGLPPLQSYAHLEWEGRSTVAGYVETTHGCKHLCRHCPIPPVYGGRFFTVAGEVVLGDIAQLVAQGAAHITFGDPDFLNGPRHGEAIVAEMHRRFPDLTFDFTAKISHLLAQREMLPRLAKQGCLFVVSALESLSPRVLAALDKGHTAQDAREALALLRGAGIALRPSLVPFTPWSTWEDYLELLQFVAAEGLAHHLEPVQFAIRLLVPPGSLLADSPDFLPHRGPLDAAGLTYQWAHPDPRMDQLQARVAGLVEQAAAAATPADATFQLICEAALVAGESNGAPPPDFFTAGPPHLPAPRLSEPWFC